MVRLKGKGREMPAMTDMAQLKGNFLAKLPTFNSVTGYDQRCGSCFDEGNSDIFIMICLRYILSEPFITDFALFGPPVTMFEVCT
jgi:hypothetical protein